MKTFGSGAKSSEQKPRYDLIEPEALERLAARMARGVESHGERNYQEGADDPEFVRDRVNHLVEHAVKYAAGDRSDDHLGAVLANANMLAWIEANQRSALSYDEKREHPVECHCGRMVSQRCSGTVCPFGSRTVQESPLSR
jgi:hypothetical protein